MSQIACIGCGGRFPEGDGPTHRYMESSPGCWACYGEVLAREYSDLDYHRVHRLTVDAYSIQHPGQPSIQCIRSVAIHAISLCGILEDNLSLDQASDLIRKAASKKKALHWLTPPASMGAMTIADIQPAKDAEEHEGLVRRWAESAWAAWSQHHPTFREWMQEIRSI